MKNARSSARNSSIQFAMYEACRTSLLPQAGLFSGDVSYFAQYDVSYFAQY